MHCVITGSVLCLKLIKSKKILTTLCVLLLFILKSKLKFWGFVFFKIKTKACLSSFLPPFQSFQQQLQQQVSAGFHDPGPSQLDLLPLQDQTSVALSAPVECWSGSLSCRKVDLFHSEVSFFIRFSFNSDRFHPTA